MNKFLTFVLLLIFFAKGVNGQSVVSFKSLGFDDDVIAGVSGSSAYFIKIDPTVQIEGSKLVLLIEPSQVLVKSQSYLNILIGDKPVYSTHLSGDSIMRYTINLTKNSLTEDHKFLKVQIRTLLNISDDKCKDIDNPAMWVKVKGTSYLSLIKTTSNFFNNVNISNCFDTKRAIVYPANPTLMDLKAVGWVYARLKKTQIKQIQVYPSDHVPDSLRNYVIVGNWASIPEAKKQLLKFSPEEGQGLLYLRKTVEQLPDTAVREVSNRNSNPIFVKTVSIKPVPSEILFVTGNGDAGYNNTITTLANSNVLNSSYGDYLIINKAENVGVKTIDESRSRLTLKDMGGLTSFLTGVGSLKNSYSFKNSDFAFTPKEIEIKIVGNYANLNLNDRGFFNIYLNGILISSEKLDQSGKLNTSALINRYELQKFNTLETEFRFYPGNGNCQNSFTNYFAEINISKSYLQTKIPFIANNLSFYQYPEAFNTGKTTIILSRRTAPNTAATIGEIIYELNNNLHADNFPDFFYSDQYDKSVLKKNNIIALLEKNDPIMDEFPDAPIKFNQRFRLYNTENNRIVYELNDTVSNGLAQIFYGRGNNGTLIITGTGRNMDKAFLSAARSITDQLSTLSSNICISDEFNKYLFNISKDSDNLEYTDAKGSFALFWESYNLYILLVILVLILISFLYVRSRVQKSQESFND
ncbi:cellulose biosynthesis cyclic di-GMP-binding regulatory protein BcsB [Mucilaginibacter paludis]|nr:cellulose biosynthesis cyclic di-GMP-binding regulatory protein BcsB [Mucilaginibacter paludis]